IRIEIPLDEQMDGYLEAGWRLPFAVKSDRAFVSPSRKRWRNVDPDLVESLGPDGLQVRREASPQGLQPSQVEGEVPVVDNPDRSLRALSLVDADEDLGIG